MRTRSIMTHGAAAVWATAGIAAVAWAAVLVLHTTGHQHLASHQEVFESPDPLGELAGFLVAWLLMIAAMMLPTVLTVMASFPAGALRFVGGYVAAWTGFGLVALAGDTAVHRVVDSWSWLGERPQLVAAGVLLVAGLYQLSPFKRHHLDNVRRAGTGRGYTASCLACCGGLMLVMFAVGVGSLAWMTLLTAAMIVEKVLPVGHRLALVVGVALVGAAPLAMLSPGAVA